MTVACLIAGTGAVCLASKMARHATPCTVADVLQNRSGSVFVPFLPLLQLRQAYSSCLFVF
jgi:hypothetical protein